MCWIHCKALKGKLIKHCRLHLPGNQLVLTPAMTVSQAGKVVKLAIWGPAWCCSAHLACLCAKRLGLISTAALGTIFSLDQLAGWESGVGAVCYAVFCFCNTFISPTLPLTLPSHTHTITTTTTTMQLAPRDAICCVCNPKHTLPPDGLQNTQDLVCHQPKRDSHGATLQQHVAIAANPNKAKKRLLSSRVKSQQTAGKQGYWDRTLPCRALCVVSGITKQKKRSDLEVESFIWKL